MSPLRRLSWLTPVHLLLGLAIAETSINRLAVPVLRPSPLAGPPPLWHSILDNFGLFLLYFASTLAVGIAVSRAVSWSRRGTAGWLIAIPLLAFAGLAATALVMPSSANLSFALQSAFALAVIAVVASALGRRAGWGMTAGLVLVAAPLVIHYGGTFIARVIFNEWEIIDADPTEPMRRYGMAALCIAAILSPYCFAPRPLARSFLRPLPLVVALLVTGLAAALVRERFSVAILIARNGMGIDLGVGVPVDQIALYILAFATVSWTLTSCAIANTNPRREVGIGLGLLILGGYGFAWPLQFLLGVVGLCTLVQAAETVGDAESEALIPKSPPIDDDVWQLYVRQILGRLRRIDPAANAVTSRGDHDVVTTVILAEGKGVPFRVRLERIGGAVLSIDIVLGEEVEESKAATFTIWARGERLGGFGVHPDPPASGRPFKVKDAGFDQRFRCRGSLDALTLLFDASLRARAVAKLDGWVAWWEGKSLRCRIYPGIGAPMDHPVPLTDLAARRTGVGTDRLLRLVQILLEAAERGFSIDDDAATSKELAVANSDDLLVGEDHPAGEGNVTPLPSDRGAGDKGA